MTAAMRFIESPEFVKEVERHLGHEGFIRLQLALAANPLAGALMVGTGGLRKVRVALPGRGKSGGARVIYLHLETAQIIFLLALYTKSAKSSLTGAEKSALRSLSVRIKAQYGGP